LITPLERMQREKAIASVADAEAAGAVGETPCDRPEPIRAG
jgi:hypothetical protein